MFLVPIAAYGLLLAHVTHLVPGIAYAMLLAYYVHHSLTR